ncbi:MerR family transcriptional regulator [Lactobacillus intestinalis]|uniref:MerR family transcriptional regulator n=1 Tax=Lactobacillus intestinalis TaxID=151781 RepID=UPI0026EDCD92|nr:MerR family transcriptional regulator [Lactobacillus intestinalis]
MTTNKAQAIHELFKNLAIGIGEVSKIVGVSQRQLRYWEKKGYIKPIDDENAGVRRYSLATVYLIAFIKDQLDEGYTLAAAYEKSKDVRVKSKISRKFFKHSFSNITVTDYDKAYGEIDLGEIHSKDGESRQLKGIVDENGSYYRIDG